VKDSPLPDDGGVQIGLEGRQDAVLERPGIVGKRDALELVGEGGRPHAAVDRVRAVLPLVNDEPIGSIGCRARHADLHGGQVNAVVPTELNPTRGTVFAHGIELPSARERGFETATQHVFAFGCVCRRGGRRQTKPSTLLVKGIGLDLEPLTLRHSALQAGDCSSPRP